MFFWKNWRKDIPEPFTNEDEIKRYLLHQVDDDTKIKHMYDEVRYARISCMSLKPTAAVFHLKWNHKNLTEEYAEILIAYLSNAHCCEIITVEDLNNVMSGIMSWSTDVPNESQSNNNTKGPQVFNSQEFNSVPDWWAFDSLLGWRKQDKVASWSCRRYRKWKSFGVIYDWTDSKGKSWIYPESAEVLLTSCDQILASKFKAQY